MKFSLVLATIGRTEELIRFLKSLNAQTYRNFELIVIDQNPDNRLTTILSPFLGIFPVIHIKSEKGLSRARNVGLKYISGDIIAFPDDDCWYPPSLLENVKETLGKRAEISGVTGRSADENGITSAGRWADKPGLIKITDVFTKGISFTIFVKKSVIEKIGNFDETLGVGAGTPWGSGEETDYLIRALKKGFQFYYDPEIIVHHPQPVVVYDKKSIERTFNYGRGMGKVLRKHRMPLWNTIYLVFVRPVGGIITSLINLNFPKTLYHWAVLRSRIMGWIK